MEAKGIPSTLILTEPFVPIMNRFALTLGLDEYTAAIKVPHRVASMDDDDLRKLADSVVDEAVGYLTT